MLCVLVALCLPLADGRELGLRRDRTPQPSGPRRPSLCCGHPGRNREPVDDVLAVAELVGACEPLLGCRGGDLQSVESEGVLGKRQ